MTSKVCELLAKTFFLEYWVKIRLVVSRINHIKYGELTMTYDKKNN